MANLLESGQINHQEPADTDEPRDRVNRLADGVVMKHLINIVRASIICGCEGHMGQGGIADLAIDWLYSPMEHTQKFKECFKKAVIDGKFDKKGGGKSGTPYTGT